MALQIKKRVAETTHRKTQFRFCLTQLTPEDMTSKTFAFTKHRLRTKNVQLCRTIIISQANNRFKHYGRICAFWRRGALVLIQAGSTLASFQSICKTKRCTLPKLLHRKTQTPIAVTNQQNGPFANIITPLGVICQYQTVFFYIIIVHN